MARHRADPLHFTRMLDASNETGHDSAVFDPEALPRRELIGVRMSESRRWWEDAARATRRNRIVPAANSASDPLQNPNSTPLAKKRGFAILFDSSDLTPGIV
jgi:hypothetical protein